MNPLLFECPTTKGRIAVGLRIDFTSLRTVQPLTIGLVCPLCDEPHEWKLHEGWIQDAPEAEGTAPAPPLAAWSPCRDAEAPADTEALSSA